MAEPKRGNLVTRGQLERVLARASELQGLSSDDGARDALTEEQVEELGKEVGLSSAAIRQALAEERARIVPEIAEDTRGLQASLFGAARIGAQRVVSGTPARVLETLDRWMQRDELLRLMRQRPDLRVWEPGRGLIDSLRRAFGSKDYALLRANEIVATAVAVDDARVLVRLEADFKALRSSMTTQAVVGTGAGTALMGAAVLMNFMLSIAVVPAVGAAAVSIYSARRQQRRALERGTIALEFVLDRLERGESEPPSFMKLIESALPPRR